METTQYIWHNGILKPWEEAKVHVLTHTLHYGGGAFEGIRVYKTPLGPAIFRLVDHIERLLFSSSVIKMQIPYTQDQLIAAVIEVIRHNKLSQGYIRPLVYYGYGVMGVNPQGAPVEVAIACWPWGAYLAHNTVNIKTSQYIRIHPRSTISEAKLCGHYINSMLARLEIQGTHYDEALLLDVNNHIAEGSGENFFIIKDDVVCTPKRGSILPGITRATVMEIAAQQGLQVIEKDITLEEAYKVDEAFFTGTAAEITPIRAINEKIIGTGNVGKLTGKIRQAYLDIVYGRNHDYLHYLSFVE